MKINLTKEQRLDLIRRVLARSLDQTESWEVDDFGSALAYLCYAISSPDISNACVDWSFEPEALRLFHKWFPEDDPVWQFIRSEGSDIDTGN